MLRLAIQRPASSTEKRVRLTTFGVIFAARSGKLFGAVAEAPPSGRCGSEDRGMTQDAAAFLWRTIAPVAASG